MTDMEQRLQELEKRQELAEVNQKQTNRAILEIRDFMHVLTEHRIEFAGLQQIVASLQNDAKTMKSRLRIIETHMPVVKLLTTGAGKFSGAFVVVLASGLAGWLLKAWLGG